MMRAIIIEESLRGNEIPAELDSLPRLKTYDHLLEVGQPITITELAVEDDDTLPVAMILSRALEPSKYYAHLVGNDALVIAFPHTVVLVDRGDEQALSTAKQVGAIFAIPDDQMRFAEMFDDDHPDAPHRAAG
ncbi:hypothetical protein [Nocardia asteroides]|uniref:hypothetical protein n=1 Tax=Nocardia asteroides TaxID=1824 RepID=UPI001E4296CA|nr:hypothetical protein [Nocardia asteroides]UGT58820.1 hypothetical protein LTT85_33250 [Nocardia asteroides]